MELIHDNVVVVLFATVITEITEFEILLCLS